MLDDKVPLKGSLSSSFEIFVASHISGQLKLETSNFV